MGGERAQRLGGSSGGDDSDILSRERWLGGAAIYFEVGRVG